MIPSLFALLLPTGFGMMLCRLAWPPGRNSAAAISFQAAVGLGLGLGIASVAYFATVLVHGSPGSWYPWVEGVAFIAGAVALVVLQRRSEAVNGTVGTTHRVVTRAVALAVLVAGLSTLVAYLFYNRMVPHGINDAIMFWNVRARFLFRGGAHWHDGFGPMYTAADYPLLLPATVARCWTYAGNVTLAGPALVALAFAIATVAGLGAALVLSRSPVQGLLTVLLLLGTTYYLETTGMLVADVPIGFYYLAAPALLHLSDRAGGRRGLVAIAGAMAGFAAWTKNDGQLFVVVLIAVRLISSALQRSWRWSEAAALLAGLGASLAGLFVFKLIIAPESDFVTGQAGEAMFTRLRDTSRYLLIAGTFAIDLLDIGPGLVVLLAVYAAMLGPTPREQRGRAWQFAAVAGLMLLGYGAVYLITPHDLKWRLDTSFDRLRMQLWPLTLFAFFLLVATPAESLAVPDSQPVAEPESPPPVPSPPKSDIDWPIGGLPRYRGGSN
jgi:hypothetical protein